MNYFFKALWALFTNNGMYSTGETIVTLFLAFIGIVVFFIVLEWKTRREEKVNIIVDLGYSGYLRHKEFMKRLGRSCVRD